MGYKPVSMVVIGVEITPQERKVYSTKYDENTGKPYKHEYTRLLWEFGNHRFWGDEGEGEDIDCDIVPPTLSKFAPSLKLHDPHTERKEGDCMVYGIEVKEPQSYESMRKLFEIVTRQLKAVGIEREPMLLHYTYWV
jgi:hypothetical protein